MIDGDKEINSLKPYSIVPLVSPGGGQASYFSTTPQRFVPRLYYGREGLHNNITLLFETVLSFQISTGLHEITVEVFPFFPVRAFREGADHDHVGLEGRTLPRAGNLHLNCLFLCSH